MGGGSKHGMLVHCQLQGLSTWRARVKISIEVPVGSVLPTSHVNPLNMETDNKYQRSFCIYYTVYLSYTRKLKKVQYKLH